MIFARAAFVCALLTVSSSALAAKKTSDPAPHHGRAAAAPKAGGAKKHGKGHRKHAPKADSKAADAKSPDSTH